MRCLNPLSRGNGGTGNAARLAPASPARAVARRIPTRREFGGLAGKFDSVHSGSGHVSTSIDRSPTASRKRSSRSNPVKPVRRLSSIGIEP